MRHIRVRAWVLVAFAATAGCIVHAPPSSAPRADNEVRSAVRTFELASGLRVVLEQAPDFGGAGAVLVVGTGSAHDPPGKQGLAHFTEHLAFRSIHDGVSLVDGLDALMDVNAATYWDKTAFHAYGNAGSLQWMLRALCGILAAPVAGIDEAIFERERLVVENEVRLRNVEETPVFDGLRAAVFSADHPYGRPTGGDLESVAKLTLQDAASLAAASYVPARASLVVIAPMPLPALQQLVESVSGQKATTRSPHEAPPAGAADRVPSPPGTTASFETTHADIANPELWIGWSIPPWTTGGDIAALLTEAVGAFTYELNYRDPDLSSVRARLVAGSAASLFSVHVILKEGTHAEETARRVVAEIHEGFEKLSHEMGGFETMRRVFGTESVYRQENPALRAFDMAWSFHDLGDPLVLQQRGARTLGLASGDVFSFANRFMSPDRAHVVFVQPGAAMPAGPGAPSRSASSPLVPAAITGGATAGGKVRREHAAIPVTALGPLLGGVTTHTLSSGLTVILFRRPGAAFHTVLLGFRGGYAQATRPGVTIAADWARRWENQSPREFGLSYEDQVDGNLTTETLRGTGSDVGATLKYMRQLIGFSVFWPPRNFTKRVEVFERADERPAPVLDRQMARAIYGSLPLGSRPTATEIQSITPADVNRWIAAVRRPGNAALVIVGDFDEEAALHAAEDQLGSWGAGGSAAGPSLPEPALKTELEAAGGAEALFVNRPGAQQATVRFQCLLPKATAESWPSRVALRNQIWSRLLSVLREDLGSSYSVSAHLDFFGGGNNTLTISTDVDYPLLGEALRRLRATLGDGAASGSTFVTNDLSTTRDWAEYLLDEWALSWPLDLRDRLAEGVAAVQPAELQALADHCRQNGIVGLMGDAPRLRSAWREAKAAWAP